MEKRREEIINELWNNIHKDRVPGFYWNNHPFMEIFYNKENNSIDCECGISINIELKENEISKKKMRYLIWDLRDKIYLTYKNQGIDLGMDD